MNDRADLGELLVQLGLAMTAAGEQVDAIQDRLYRVAAAHGVADVDVIVLPTTMLIELGSDARTNVRLGVPSTTVPRLDQVSDLYVLVGELERGDVGVADARIRLDALLVAPPRHNRVVRIAGYSVLCAGLSLLLQPSWGGLLAAIALGLVVGVLTTWRFASLAMVMPVLASFLVAVCVFVSAEWFDADNPIRTLIPPLITFLPGALLTTGTVELAAGQVISGSTRLVQGLVVLGMMAFGIVAAAELVGAPSAHLLDHPFTRLGAWAPWVGLLAVAAGQWLFNCAPFRTVGPIVVVLVAAHVGQLLGSALFGATVSGFFGAAAMTPIVLWMSEQWWGPPKMVTFMPGFWLLVPGAAGLIGATELVGTDSSLGAGDFTAAITTIFSIALGILVSSAFYNSTRVGVDRMSTLGASVRRRWR